MSRHHPAHQDYHNAWLRTGVVFDPTGGIATAILAGASVAGTAANLYGTIAQGNAQRGQEDYQAQQQAQESKAAFATGSQKAAQQAQVGAFALSRDEAVASASGATATSPSVENVEKQVAGNSEYNVLSSVYEGQEAANSHTQQEMNDYYMGKEAKAGSSIKALSTTAASGTSMLENYGNPFESNDSGGLLTTSVGGSPSAGMYGPFQNQTLPWQ